MCLFHRPWFWFLRHLLQCRSPPLPLVVYSCHWPLSLSSRAPVTVLPWVFCPGCFLFGTVLVSVPTRLPSHPVQAFAQTSVSRHLTEVHLLCIARSTFSLCVCVLACAPYVCLRIHKPVGAGGQPWVLPHMLFFCIRKNIF